jgi:putative addiction module component (TIGR02574 family)
MSSSINKLLLLPDSEKLEIISLLMDSLHEKQNETDLDDELKSVLDFRLEQFYKNPDAGKPLAQVVKEAKARYGL